MIMKSKILFFSISVLILSCSTSSIIENYNGNKVVDERRILIPSGALINTADIIENDIKYTLGLTSNNEIKYVSTNDTKFKIEGLSVNMELSNIESHEELRHIKGWGYFIKTNSDWYAAFDFKERPNSNSKIQFFFKYKFAKSSTNIFE